MRYGLYERAVTFDGPDVYSTSIPIRGTILSSELKDICDSLVEQMANVSRNGNSMIFNQSGTGQEAISMLLGGKSVARMVVHFKLDSQNRIWLLYSSSLRLVERMNRVPMIRSFVRNCHPDTSSTSPINISNIVKLPPSIQLNQKANHNRSVITKSQELSLVICISCARKESLAKFQGVSYKTIVSQYENAMIMLKSSPDYVSEWQWPPKTEYIKAAGGVGFGPLWMGASSSRHSETKQLEYSRLKLGGGIRLEPERTFISEEDLVIPPMIRHLHPRLRVDGYQRYHIDSHFLQKTCPVCERCFLSFANLVTSSFQMIRPVIIE